MSFPIPKHESFTQEGTGNSSAIYTVVNAGLYRAYISATFIAPSTIAASVVQAGSTSVTTAFPTPNSIQTHGEINVLLTCAVGDTITFAATCTDPTNSCKVLFNVIQTNSGI